MNTLRTDANGGDEAIGGLIPDLVPVILSGGAGTRLWPVSRQILPKQYHRLLGARTMLVETVERLRGVCSLDGLTVVCNNEHRFLVAEQLQAAGSFPQSILLEPVGRNTAPAVAVAALEILSRQEGDPLLLILPSDHVIQDRPSFHTALRQAAELARNGALVTFGVPATSPETGYGYIRRGAPLPLSHGQAWEAHRFVEKPPLDAAQEMVQSGKYFWNSGMFLFRASAILESLEHHAPEVLTAAHKAVAGLQRDLDFSRLERSALEACPAISLDYAVMERASQVAVVPLNAGWSDVGSWHALWENLPKNGENTAQQGDVMAVDCHGSLLLSTSRMVGALGLRDMVVVETADAILVAPRHRSQEVKHLVDRLREQNREEVEGHLRVFRPWGFYQCVDRADRFQVKRITVHPGAILSLQLHRHRAEHWVVVTGVARVTCGEKCFLLEENQSTYIPVGVKHRLENPGTTPLELIEVQSGHYLGEDDIERFEDRYRR